MGDVWQLPPDVVGRGRFSFVEVKAFHFLRTVSVSTCFHKIAFYFLHRGKKYSTEAIKLAWSENKLPWG